MGRRIKRKQKEENKPIEKINIESMNNESTRVLYQDRLKQMINNNEITSDDNAEIAWIKLKTNIIQAAEEACGKRKVHNRINETPWFTEEVKQLSKEKKLAYLKYRTTKTVEEWNNYKDTRNRITSRIREIKEEYWETFTKDMEHDLTGAQRKVWRLIRKRRAEITETKPINVISKEKWTMHFRDIYGDDDKEENSNNQRVTVAGYDAGITMEDLQETILKLRNRKAPGMDGVVNEMLKYGGPALQD